MEIIHKDHNDWLDKEAVEKRYNAKYVGEFSVKGKFQTWSDTPVSVFYQENPPHNYSNYMGLFYCGMRENVFITSAAVVKDCVYTGIISENGTTCTYSGHRHDFQKLPTGEFIDGGLDYIRTNAMSQLCKLKINKDKLEVFNEKDKA